MIGASTADTVRMPRDGNACFQQLAAMEHSAMNRPMLLFWGARGLYLGPALGLRPHRNSVAVLCVALDAPAQLARDPRDGEAGHVGFRTALIPPNTLHHLCSPRGNRMAFLYVDALSEDYPRLHARMRVIDARLALGHEAEAEVIACLAAIAAGADWRATRASLARVLGLGASHGTDPRVDAALTRLRAAPDDDHSLARMAREAGLSPSRFLHLFTAATGVPLRRYRLWLRIGAALRAMRAGSSLTEAAHAAGFSSSAHFSSAFSAMFGLAPSRLTPATCAPAQPPDIPSPSITPMCAGSNPASRANSQPRAA